MRFPLSGCGTRLRKSEQEWPLRFSAKSAGYSGNEASNLDQTLQIAFRILEKGGCQADVVANGRDAVAAGRNYYDLILMDVPEMDGFEATAAIRAIESGRRTPIIATPANAMSENREKCLQAGRDDYVSKPICVPDLERALDRGLPDSNVTLNQESPDLATLEA